jgi:RNA polymerase sigma factor (sigma-70 family)
MQKIETGGGNRVVSPNTQIDAAGRNRAAVETFARHEAALRRTALRFSLCADDADEALGRGLEILLRKAPSEDPRELVRWTQTVVKHEALALRRERERVLAGPAAAPAASGEDWTAMIPSGADGPAEQVERRETVARSREALQRLKPAELRALTLLAEGYSYKEIGAITGFSATKVNRALAEGRERFRRFFTRAAEGERCGELGPLISAFADGEAGAAEATSVREHLRACPNCRATLHAYRAAPRAAAALAPVLPLHRSLAERAHDAVAGIVTRFGGGDSALAGVAAGGGTRGTGMAALAKVLAVCAGTVGGAAACVAGVVPAPLALVPDEPHHVRSAPAQHKPVRHLIDATEAGESGGPAYEPEPPPAVEEPSPETTTTPQSEADPQPKPHHEAAPTPEVAPEPPATEAGAVEYTPPPEEATAVPEAPAPSATSSASSSSSSAGSAAGEFGP